MARLAQQAGRVERDHDEPRRLPPRLRDRLGGFNRPYPRRRVSLPTYPFEHRRFWIEADATERSTASLSNGLTGGRLRSALPDAQFNAYSLQRFAYLDDHRIYGMPVLPTTAGLTALRDAARQYFGTDAIEIANLQYREAMVLPENGERIVQSILTPLGDSAAEFRLASIGLDAADTWRTHMVGVARKESSARNAPTASLSPISSRRGAPVRSRSPAMKRCAPRIGIRRIVSRHRAAASGRRRSADARSAAAASSSTANPGCIPPCSMPACISIRR